MPVDKTVSGFEYEDVEGLIDREFRNHLEFSLDLAESADDPANPESHLGNTVEDFYLDSFAVSCGDPQVVQVLAKRELGAVTLNYKINGVTQEPKSTEEWSDGQRYYQEAGVVYHRLRGAVTGTGHGDEVEVWFAAAGKKSPSFTYTVHSDTGSRVLLLAAEDYTGPTPADADGQPNYSTIPGRARREQRRLRHLRRRRDGPHAPHPSACSGTTTRSSGSPATTT